MPHFPKEFLRRVLPVNGSPNFSGCTRFKVSEPQESGAKHLLLLRHKPGFVSALQAEENALLLHCILCLSTLNLPYLPAR